MKSIIRRCLSDEHDKPVYSLGETCRVCGKETENSSPPRFSPKDKYGKYRRKTKWEDHR
ncbi:RNA-protein complex protein Nop10 [Halorutilales archaeon Cl-col2-1]